MLDAAQLTAADRVMLAFSFGPFIGFWTAHDAAPARGALVVPGSGLNTLARLELIQTSQANRGNVFASFARREKPKKSLPLKLTYDTYDDTNVS